MNLFFWLSICLFVCLNCQLLRPYVSLSVCLSTGRTISFLACTSGKPRKSSFLVARPLRISQKMWPLSSKGKSGKGFNTSFNFQLGLQTLPFQIKRHVCHIWPYSYYIWQITSLFVPLSPFPFTNLSSYHFFMKMVFSPASRRMPARYFILT